MRKSRHSIAAPFSSPFWSIATGDEELKTHASTHLCCLLPLIKTEWAKQRTDHDADSHLQSLKIVSFFVGRVPLTGVTDRVRFAFGFKTARALEKVFHRRFSRI
jgi:hypothetical protein